MNAIETIKSTISLASGFSEGLLRDMESSPYTRTTPEVGQHPYWLLGHLVVSEGALLDMYLLGNANRYQAWTPLFGIGSSPTDSMDGGPSYSELLDALQDIRSQTLSYINTLSEDDLDKPCLENDWGGPKFASVGTSLQAFALHMCIHGGQVACARRAAGRKPLHF